MADAAEATPAPEPETKPKAVRVPEPDREKHMAAVEALHEQIQAKKARLDEIRTQIDVKNTARKGVRDGSSDIRDQLKEIRGRRNAKIEEKKAIRTQMQALKRVDLPSKKDQPRMNPEQIFGKIAAMEHKQQTEAMSILEEKELMKELKQLRSSVAAVKNFHVNIEDLKSKRLLYDTDRKTLSALLSERDVEIDAIKVEEEKIIAILDEKNSAADQVGNGIPELIEERNKMRPEVPEIYEQIKALKAEFKKENDLWWDGERAHRAQERVEQQAKWEAQKGKRAAEYEADRKYRMEQNEDGDEDLHFDDKAKCDALAAYLTTLLPVNATEAVAAKETDHGGATVINKKMLDDEEFWGQHKKTKGKKKKKAVVAKAAMTHPMDRIQSLHDFGLDVPNDIAAVMVAIKKVLAKKAEYLAKGASAPKKVVRVYRPLVCRVRISPVGDKDIKVAIEAL